MPTSAGDSDHQRLAEPPLTVWTRLGLTPEVEIRGGYQSRIFRATSQAGQLVVKLIEATEDGALTRQRAEITRQLAEINPAVVGPVGLGPDLVTDIDVWRVICYPYVEGRSPAVDSRDDVAAMATTLATLHDSMAALTDPGLPPVAALQDAQHERLQREQIIHGDYAAANLIVTPAGLRIIDFGDCGKGSVEFEIGNSLYMVLFDSWLTGSLDRYDRFRSWLVDDYRAATSIPIDEQLLDPAIQVRARALGRWLADPATAPTGIRTASAEWRGRLRSFVEELSDATEPRGTRSAPS